MKKFIQTVRSMIGIPSIASLLVLVGIAGGCWWYTNSTLIQFTNAYATYKTLAAQQQNAAFLPGASENPLRGELNAVLAQVLDQKTTDKNRLVLAHQGLDLIVQSNAQVDAIGVVATDVTSASDALATAAALPGNMLRKSRMQSIVSTAKQELYTVEDIRGLSYRTNFEVAEIFNRIITDKGALTPDYTKELNSDLPSAEASFNKRQDAYAALQKQIYQIEQDYSALTGS